MKKLLLILTFIFLGSGVLNASDKPQQSYLGQAQRMVHRVIESGIEEVKNLLGERGFEQEHEQCSICLEALDGQNEVLSLPVAGNICGHSFHENCIQEWARQQASCPTCRTGFSLSDILPVEELELQNQGLTSVERLHEVKHKNKIKRIYLRSNRIERLPENAFEGFSNLEILSLARNPLLSIEGSAFRGLSNLKELDLESANVGDRENKLVLTADVFAPLVSLESIDLEDNKLRFIPAGIRHLTNLKKLWLKKNNLELRYRDFARLTSLEELSLEANHLQSLPVGMFSNLTRLKRLSLGDNQFPPAELDRIVQEVQAASPNCDVDFYHDPSSDELSDMDDIEAEGVPLIFDHSYY